MDHAPPTASSSAKRSTPPPVCFAKPKMPINKNSTWVLAPLPTKPREDTQSTQSSSASELSEGGTQEESYLADLLADTQFSSATQSSKLAHQLPNPSGSQDPTIHQKSPENSSRRDQLDSNVPDEKSPGPETPKASQQDLRSSIKSKTPVQVTKSPFIAQPTPLQHPKYSQSEYVRAIEIENLSIGLEEGTSPNSVPLQSTCPPLNARLPCPPDVTLELSTENIDQSIDDSPSLQSTNPSNNPRVFPRPSDVTLHLSRKHNSQSIINFKESIANSNHPDDSLPLSSTYPGTNNRSIAENIPQSVSQSPNVPPLQSTNRTDNSNVLPRPPDLTLDLSRKHSSQSIVHLQDSTSNPNPPHDELPLCSTYPTANNRRPPFPPEVTLDLSEENTTHQFIPESPNVIPLQSTNPPNNTKILPRPPDFTLDLSEKYNSQSMVNLQDSTSNSNHPDNDELPLSSTYPGTNNLTLAEHTHQSISDSPNVIPLQSTNPANHPLALPRPPNVTLDLSREDGNRSIINIPDSASRSNPPDEAPSRSNSTSFFLPGWDSEPAVNNSIDETSHSSSATVIPPTERVQAAEVSNPTQSILDSEVSRRIVEPQPNTTTAPHEPPTVIAQALVPQNPAQINSVAQVNNHVDSVENPSISGENIASAAGSSLRQNSNTTSNIDDGIILSIGPQIADEGQPPREQMPRVLLGNLNSPDASLFPSIIKETPQLRDNTLEDNTEQFDIAHIATTQPRSSTEQRLSDVTLPQIETVTRDLINQAQINIGVSSPNGQSSVQPATLKYVLESTDQIASSQPTPAVFSQQRRPAIADLSPSIAIEHITNTARSKRKRSLNEVDRSTQSPIGGLDQVNEQRSRDNTTYDFQSEHAISPQLPPPGIPILSSHHPSTSDKSSEYVQQANVSASTSRVTVVVPSKTRQHKRVSIVKSIKSTSRVQIVLPPTKGKGKAVSRVPPPPVVASRPARLQAVRESTTHALPVQQVLAYRQDWEAFLPGEIDSITPDQVIVNFYDGESLPRDLKHLRLCDIRAGDVVKYIGSDLADGESQFTSVRHPKRVLKIEKDVEMIDVLTHSRHDVLACCDECDYDQLSKSSNPVEKSRQPSRFLLEAIMVVPPGSRKYTGLKDRVLAKKVNNQLCELMKAHSGVGMRNKSAAITSTNSIRLATKTVSADHIFQGFGILLTSAGQDSKPCTTRKRSATTQREIVEQQIVDRRGTVIHQVSDLYNLIGSDIDPSSLREGISGNQSILSHQDPYRFTPSSKHQSLHTILLVAETPSKTFKYLMALALGIPCVSSKWVTHSCESGHVLDWERYMIGPGPSTFLGGVQSLINIQTPLTTRINHDLLSIFDFHPSLQLFKDKTFVYLSSKTKNKSDWIETVRPILCATGATKISSIEMKSIGKKREDQEVNFLKKYDYILLEDHLSLDLIPSSIIKSLNLKSSSSSNNPTKRRKLFKTFSHTSSGSNSNFSFNNIFDHDFVCIVDFEWLKQSLIYGHILKPQFFATSQ